MVKPSATVFIPQTSKACLLMRPNLKTINTILMKRTTAKIIVVIQMVMMALITPKILHKKLMKKTIPMMLRSIGLNAPVRVVTALAITKFGMEPTPMVSLTGIKDMPPFLHRQAEDLAPMVSSVILFMELTSIASAALSVSLLLRLTGLSVLMNTNTATAPTISGTVPRDPMVCLMNPKAIPLAKELKLEELAQTVNSVILYTELLRLASAVVKLSQLGNSDKSSIQMPVLLFGDQEMDTGITKASLELTGVLHLVMFGLKLEVTETFQFQEITLEMVSLDLLSSDHPMDTGTSRAQDHLTGELLPETLVFNAEEMEIFQFLLITSMRAR